MKSSDRFRPIADIDALLHKLVHLLRGRIVSDGRDHWFIYSRSAGRMTATPGWAAFLLLLAATIALGYAVMLMTSNLHFAFRLIALSAVIVSGVLTILRLALAKGRRVN